MMGGEHTGRQRTMNIIQFSVLKSAFRYYILGEPENKRERGRPLMNEGSTN